MGVTLPFDLVLVAGIKLADQANMSWLFILKIWYDFGAIAIVVVR